MIELRKFDWNWYHENLIRCVQNAEPNCQYLLDLIEEFDSVAKGLTERDMSIDSDRPHDYIVPVLAVRSYRLAISAIWNALSGFPDSVPNLIRTIFEIGIRLLDMTDDPVAASLGYLMQGAQEEVSTIQEELNFRRENGHECGNLEKNLVWCV